MPVCPMCRDRDQRDKDHCSLCSGSGVIDEPSHHHKPIIASFSDITCGEACWHAKEGICRCSCGGKNHGCLTQEGAERPARTAKIDGERYQLKAVGEFASCEKEASLLFVDPKSTREVTGFNGDKHVYKYYWRSTDKGAPARVKCASKDQLAKWPELSAWRDQGDRWRNPPHLLWVKI